MRRFVIGVLAAGTAFAQPPPDPVLAAARGAALRYSETLPDFTCTAFITRYQNYGSLGHQLDTLTLEVGYYKHREMYRLVARDNHPTHMAIGALNGSFTEGEFGSALRLAFDPASEAVYERLVRERIRRRVVAVYSYAVGEGNSRYELQSGTQKIMTAYHGRIYIDPAANRVLRLTMAVDPSPSFPVREVATTIDYEDREISGASYLLPVRADVHTLEYVPIADDPGFEPVRYRNYIEFRNYRKFSADSKLTFER